VRHVQQRNVWVVRQQCQLLLRQVKQLQQAALAGVRKHLPVTAAAAARIKLLYKMYLQAKCLRNSTGANCQ
jgi:hypothetical protein